MCDDRMKIVRVDENFGSFLIAFADASFVTVTVTRAWANFVAALV